MNSTSLKDNFNPKQEGWRESSNSFVKCWVLLLSIRKSPDELFLVSNIIRDFKLIERYY